MKHLLLLLSQQCAAATNLITYQFNQCWSYNHETQLYLNTIPRQEAEDDVRNINRRQATERAEKCRFYLWWPWTLTVLDIKTRQHEESNTSSMWIWHKSVQRFPKAFHTQRHRQRQKQNLPQFTACGKNCTKQKITKTALCIILTNICILMLRTFITTDTWPRGNSTGHQLSYFTSSPFSTEMGDHSWYTIFVCNQPFRPI